MLFKGCGVFVEPIKRLKILRSTLSPSEKGDSHLPEFINLLANLFLTGKS